MANLIKIKTNKHTNISKKVLSYLNPDYVYIPIASGYKLYVKEGDIVNKEEILLYKNNNYIYSPISGKVLGASTMMVGEEKKKTIVIENDFREKTKKVKGIKRNINNYSQDDVLALTKAFNAYSGSFVGKIMVVNGMDNEPYVFTNSYIISEYTNELLETIDALYSIFHVDRCYLAIKNNDTDNVNELVNHIGTYPNIDLKLMPDLYPLGNKDILVKELVSSKKRNTGVIYLTVDEILAIYNVLKRSKPITERLITVNGDKLDCPRLVKVKVGTALKDLLKNNFKIIDEDYKIIINGLMAGFEVNNMDFIITSDVKSIFITSIPNALKKKCINCGMCHTKCPVGCDPRYNFKMDDCINCGICSYVCPARINFKRKVDK